VQGLTRPNGSFTEYQYADPLKRLTNVDNRDSLSQVINAYTYTYNARDLRDTETITNGEAMPALSNSMVASQYNPANQLLSSTDPNRVYTYDDDGNMTQGYTPGGYAVAMAYDAANRLISAEYTDGGGVVHRAEYGYRGDGFLARVLRYEDGVPVDERRFVRAGFLTVQERDGNNAVIREYVWNPYAPGGIGGLLGMKEGGADYSYLYDGKGNVTAVLDSSGQVVAAYRYDEFGNLMASSGTLAQPYTFSTKRYLEGIGQYYYGYRNYSPSCGMWTTRDPLGEAGGINLYGFVGNDPLMFVDPLGEFKVNPVANIKNLIGCTYNLAKNAANIEKYRKECQEECPLGGGKSIQKCATDKVMQKFEACIKLASPGG
jgi:RHS repeat-associated protein